MEGYAKLASLMGTYPEALIFRRFGALSAQNLLHLQAELVHLEQELQATANRGPGDEAKRTTMANDWFTLAHSDNCNEEQWEIMLRVRAMLKEYGDALLQRSQLQQQQEANPQEIAWLQEWMERPTMGGVYLLGPDSEIWEKPVPGDLIKLQPAHKHGTLASWVKTPGFHRLIGRHFKSPEHIEKWGNTVHYSEDGLLRVASLVAMSFASLMPIAAITVLYAVTSMPVRLGLVAGFTVVFTLLCGTLTHGKAIEVFAATTAFVAIQVVFIGTSRNSC